MAASVPLDASLAPRAKAAMAAEVVVAYVRARRALRRVGLRRTLGELRRPGPAPQALVGDPVALGRRLAPVVVRTLAALPTDSRCLMRSLVLTRLLARRGVATQLVIAVRPGERFGAHAWIEYDGVALLPVEGPSFEQLVTL